LNAYEKVPADLKNLRQWVCWKEVTRDGKKTKLPVTPAGKPASSTDKATWNSFGDCAAAGSMYSGIGFVFSSEDSFVGIDLDGCRNPQTGELEKWAKDVVLRLGTYTEVSPSGTGVKLFGSTGEKWNHRNKVDLQLKPKHGKNPGVEVYDNGRFFCVTSRRLQGATEVMPVDENYDWLADTLGMRYSEPVVDGSGLTIETPVSERAAKYLEKMDSSVSGQSGHNKLFKAACAMVLGFDLSQSESYTLLARDFNPRCNPPWSEREIRHKVNSADRQPGARGYLRDAQPEQWSKIRIPSTYKEHHEESRGQPELRKTTIKEAAKRYLNELKSGGQLLLETGLPELDYAIGGGVAFGEMVIVAARPSHGKSAIALQMAHSMSESGLPIVFVSEEMSSMALGKRAIQYLSDTPERAWTENIGIISNQVDKHFSTREEVYIVESCGSVERACETIEQHVNENKVKVAMVDYAQLLSSKGSSNRYEMITRVSSSLRMLASRLNIVVVVLAQLNRQIESRKQFVPQMSDLRETGQLEQDADVILFGVWPYKIDPTQEQDKYQFFIAKNRNRAIKKPLIVCTFDASRQCLLERDSGEWHE